MMNTVIALLFALFAFLQPVVGKDDKQISGIVFTWIMGKRTISKIKQVLIKTLFTHVGTFFVIYVVMSHYAAEDTILKLKTSVKGLKLR